MFPGPDAAGDQIRLLTTCHDYTLDKRHVTFDLLWPERLFHKSYHQDQTETPQHQIDYLLRFVPDRNFDFDHVLVDDQTFQEHFKFLNTAHRDAVTNGTANNFPIELSYDKVLKLNNTLLRKDNKIVFWKDTFIHHDQADVGNCHLGKRPFNYQEWQKLFYFLKNNYEVVEIEYRTPISEVMYHLSTCEVCVGQSGLWNLNASALHTPQITFMKTDTYDSRIWNQEIQNQINKSGFYKNGDFNNFLSVAGLDVDIDSLLNYNVWEKIIDDAKDVMEDA